MSGVSLIKIYFQPGTDANADVTQISNLAMADLRRLPQGTLPPVVMNVDASSLARVPADRGRPGSFTKRNCTITCNIRFETRSPAFPARPCRRHTAGSTARSWCMWIR